MGLDMYLEQKMFVNPGRVEVMVDGKVREDVSAIIYEIGYWRKANAIHNWFVKNVQNGVDECQYSYLNIHHLETLKALCLEVLADHTKAEALLPPIEGFFFGSTGIDEWYFEDLENTVKSIDKALASQEGWGDFYYHSSW